MMPWIQVYSNLPEHPKIYRLTEALGSAQSYQSLGIVVSLWLWAARNAPEGDLSSYPRWALANAVGWQGNSEALCDALISTGFLDQNQDGGLHIHDWEDHAVMLLEILERGRSKNRERVRRYRKKRAQEALPPENVPTEATPATEPTHASPASWPELLAEFSALPRWNVNNTEELQGLYADLGAQKCRKALQLARERQAEYWPYIRGILENWRDKLQAPQDEDRSLERAQYLAANRSWPMRGKEESHGLEERSPE